VLVSDAFYGPTNDKGQSCEAVTYRKKRIVLQLANLTKHFNTSAQGQVDRSLAVHRAQDEIFYILGILHSRTLLFCLVIITTNGQCDALGSAQRYLTHHGDHRVTLRRGQATRHCNRRTQLRANV